MSIELGSGSAIIKKVETTMDGGAKVTFEFDQTNAKLIQELLRAKLSGDDYVSIGVVKLPN